MEEKICHRCGSTNISYQVVTNTIVKNKHHSIIWWLLVGWWWIPIKWIYFTGLAIILFILKLLGVRRKRTVVVDRTMGVCQDCGHTWQI